MRTYHPDGTLPESETEIFVFGSNLAGRHGAGAAKVAQRQFGAQTCIGVGHVGRSYAVPTKDFSLRSLPLHVIKLYVDLFVAYAAGRPHLTFFVTSVGCGLAGYKPAEIAPMFKYAPETCSFPDTWREHLEAGEDG